MAEFCNITIVTDCRVPAGQLFTRPGTCNGPHTCTEDNPCDTQNNEWIEAALAAPCEMVHTPPMDFASCLTHDETFPLGEVCPIHRTHHG